MNEERTVTLEERILHLISLQQEGGYWDFKKQWYEKKSDMLHDIICMANNLHNCTAYIIIGVDEKQGYAVVDVKNDANRRNTQNIVDFLKDKKFAGGVRPLVHVEQLSLYHGDIDVIVVENSRNTPFYLTERFEGICANHIYTRVMDTNTPIDRSADINNVEYLWRKRFHLDDTPIGKFHHYLKNPDDWYSMQDQNMGYFYKYSPEYTITCEKDICTDGYEYYIFGQVDTRPSWYLITLKYHQTSIELFQGLSLDGGRSFVIAPQRAYDLMDADISSIGFYICDDLRARLLEFYHCKDTSDEYAYRAYMRSMIVFRSEREHKQFIRYVKENKERYNVLYAQQGDKGLPHFPEIEGYIMDTFKNEYRDALVIQKMLTEFRNGTLAEITEDKIYADT